MCGRDRNRNWTRSHVVMSWTWGTWGYVTLCKWANLHKWPDFKDVSLNPNQTASVGRGRLQRWCCGGRRPVQLLRSDDELEIKGSRWLTGVSANSQIRCLSFYSWSQVHRPYRTTLTSGWQSRDLNLREHKKPHLRELRWCHHLHSVFLQPEPRT